LEFRHAVLRDAAYQLQLPAGRAGLHALAFATLEGLCGGRAPEAGEDSLSGSRFRPHATDRFAFELSEHARRVVEAAESERARRELEPMRLARTLYLGRAAEVAERSFRTDEAIRLWEAAAELFDGDARGRRLRRAAAVAVNAGRSGLRSRCSRAPRRCSGGPETADSRASRSPILPAC
jgi:hypothetical protein